MRIAYKGIPCTLQGVGYAKKATPMFPAQYPNALHLLVEEEVVVVKATKEGDFLGVTCDGKDLNASDMPSNKEEFASWAAQVQRAA